MVFRTKTYKLSEQKNPDSLHIIIPHRTNWRLTQASVKAFLRLTKRPHSITLVNNFDEVPADLSLLKEKNVSILSNELTPFGKLWRKVFKENGSKSNALALHCALRTHPQFKWALMAHSDSSPLTKNWDEYYFSAMNGHKIMANFRDIIRIHAAHASGTLFDQQEFLKHGASLAPEFYPDGSMYLDVGDRATVVLHPEYKKIPVPCLPNTYNDKSLIRNIETKHPVLAALARDGSAISLDVQTQAQPVFGHMGRGTPRNLGSPQFKHKLPVDTWIEMIEGIQ